MCLHQTDVIAAAFKDKKLEADFTSHLLVELIRPQQIMTGKSSNILQGHREHLSGGGIPKYIIYCHGK